MAVLTVDVGGPNEMDIACERGGHAAPRTLGGKSNSGSGSEWSQIRGEFMVVPFVAAPLPWDTIATIRSLFALKQRVNCAGDVFNKPGTIVCVGTLTDDLHETADRGTLSGTLYEVGNVGGYTPAISTFILTSVDSPDSADPVTFVSTPDGSYPGDGLDSVQCLASATPLTCACPAPGGCAIVTSSSPETSWLSVPLAAGIITGRPTFRFETQGSSATVWAHMSTKALLYQVRGGVNIAGPFETDYFGTFGGLGASTVFASVTSPIVLVLQNDDRLLVELWSRLALNCDQTDNGGRQTIWYGAVPGPRQRAIMTVGGFITSYP